MNNKLYFSNHHLWIRLVDNGIFHAGISEHAQQMLGDIVFVESPTVGQRLTAEQPCGLVESVKTASDLNAPLAGVVTDVNEAVINNPQLLDEAPEDNWIFSFRPDNADDCATLMDSAAYRVFTG